VAAAAGVQLDEHTLNAAAQSNHLQLCVWLRDSAQCPWHEDACIDAARSNQLALLRWLRDSGCPTGNVGDVALNAVIGCGNDVTVLQYMLEQGLLVEPELLTFVLQQAGLEGHLVAAQWLRQQGALWPAVLYDVDHQQAWCGEVLDWARAEGCTAVAVLPHNNENNQ
jgi:hypothetical protein